MMTFFIDLVFRPKRFFTQYFDTPEQRPYYRGVVGASILFYMVDYMVVTLLLILLQFLMAYGAANDQNLVPAHKALVAVLQVLAAYVKVSAHTIFLTVCFGMGAALSYGLYFALWYWIAGWVSKLMVWVLGGRCSIRTARSLLMYEALGSSVRFVLFLFCGGGLAVGLYQMQMYHAAFGVATAAFLLYTSLKWYTWFVGHRALTHIKKGRAILWLVCVLTVQGLVCLSLITSA